MRRTAFIFVTVILISLAASSCDRGAYRELADIESYAAERPDSALQALEKIDASRIRRAKVRARYCLLKSVALDKNHMDVTDDFLQRTAVRTSAYAARADYRHIFDADNTLEAGLSANAGRVDYDYFYGLRSADGYESDPGRTNRFVYDDLNLAGYASYSRVWSDKFESEVGARVELYRARGTQLTDYGTVDRDDFGVYPTLSLLYMPSDAHELSLDLSTSIARPTYTMLNPFITYTSPTTCTQFNPDLKASRDLDLMFCYVLLDDYMLTVDYWYASDTWTEFVLPDGDMTRNFTANYGNSHDLYASLIVSKSLFKGRWNLSAEAELDYSYEFGGIEGRPIDNHNLNWDITLKNNVALSRRHNWYLDVKYQYHSASSWVAYDFPARQEMEAYLMKEFDRASLSIGVYGSFLQNTFHASGHCGSSGGM